MQAGDLPAGLALTQAVGWSHRLADWQLAFSLGKGWVAGDSSGRVVGTIIVWNWSERAATLGFVIVDPALQGKGLGRRLMDKALQYTGGRAVQLAATDAGLKLYRDCGFAARGSIEQWQAADLSVKTPPPLPNLQLRTGQAEDLGLLVELDADAFGAKRPALIESVLASGNAVIAVQDGRPRGFAMRRPSGRGLVIGPLVAVDQDMAIVLAAEQMRGVNGLVRIDVPGDADQLRRWLATAGLGCVDRVTIMVRGAWPPMAQRGMRRLALAAQALG